MRIAGSAPSTPYTMDSSSRRPGHGSTNTTQQGVSLRTTTQ